MMQVLVVNGRTDERRAIVEALSQLEGVAVQGSMSDLETATRVLSRYTPDLLVTGTELADADGLRLVEAARRRGMLIVVVGNAASREVWLRYLEAGADRFVEPDRDLEELQDVVRALVRQLGAADPELPLRVPGAVVYDFSNYLHTLEVLLELLERSPGDKHLWTEARVSLAQATCLTATLLGQLRGHRPRAAPLDLSAIVRSAAAFARQVIAPRIEVAVEIAEPLPPVLGVASELERMVLDLVLNASEAIEDGGRVRVVGAQANDSVLLAVTNDGADVRGAPAGLALDAARSIVERHRGTLFVARCEPASSSVLVTLPISARPSC